MQNINPAWFYRLKAAQRDIIKICGGIERCADLTSTSKSQVGRWNNANDPDIMGIQTVVILENECGLPIITTAQAGLNGWRLADPEEKQKQKADILASFSKTVSHASELMQSGALAMSDGKITPAEASEIDRTASLLEQQLAELRNTLAHGKVSTLQVIPNGKNA